MNALHIGFVVWFLAPVAAAEPPESPVLSGTSLISADGTVEYRWTITSIVGGNRLLSIIELDRHGGKKLLTDGGESLWYSRELRPEAARISFSVHPAAQNQERSIRFAGTRSRTANIRIPDTAIVTVDSRQIRADDHVKHVIDVTIANDGRELKRYLSVIRVTNLRNHPRFMAELRDLQAKSQGVPVEEISYVDQIDEPAACFAEYAQKPR